MDAWNSRSDKLRFSNPAVAPPGAPRARRRPAPRRRKATPPRPQAPVAEGSPLFEPEYSDPDSEPTNVGAVAVRAHNSTDRQKTRIAPPDCRDGGGAGQPDDHSTNRLPAGRGDHIYQSTAQNVPLEIASSQRQPHSTTLETPNAHVMYMRRPLTSRHADAQRRHSTPSLNLHTEHPINVYSKERRTYRDDKGVLRDIWQPGDGDGSRSGEVMDTVILNKAVERFRFFQHDIGLIDSWDNPPPKYVILDDKACYDIWMSNHYSARDRVKYWYHDFASQGNIKHMRPNRGRPALVSEADGGQTVDRNDICGAREVGWAYTGDAKKQRKYFFTGERNGYIAVQFRPPLVTNSSLQEETLPAQTSRSKGKGKVRSRVVEASIAQPPRHASPRYHQDKFGGGEPINHKRSAKKAFTHLSPPTPPPNKRQQRATILHSGLDYDTYTQRDVPTTGSSSPPVAVRRSSVAAFVGTKSYEKTDHDGEKSGVLDPATAPTSKRVSSNFLRMENVLKAAMRQLKDKDEEILHLRREVQRLKRTYVHKTRDVAREERDIVDLASDDSLPTNKHHVANTMNGDNDSELMQAVREYEDDEDAVALAIALLDNRNGKQTNGESSAAGYAGELTQTDDTEAELDARLQREMQEQIARTRSQCDLDQCDDSGNVDMGDGTDDELPIDLDDVIPGQNLPVKSIRKQNHDNHEDNSNSVLADREAAEYTDQAGRAEASRARMPVGLMNFLDSGDRGSWP